jgi:ferredoxin
MKVRIDPPICVLACPTGAITVEEGTQSDTADLAGDSAKS